MYTSIGEIKLTVGPLVRPPNRHVYDLSLGSGINERLNSLVVGNRFGDSLTVVHLSF